jgi:hypothetical protein
LAWASNKNDDNEAPKSSDDKSIIQSSSPSKSKIFPEAQKSMQWKFDPDGGELTQKEDETRLAEIEAE